MVSKRKTKTKPKHKTKKKNPSNFQHFSLVLFLFEWFLAFEHEHVWLQPLWTHFGNRQLESSAKTLLDASLPVPGESLHCLVPFELQCELRFWDLMLLQWRGGTGSPAAVCLSPPRQTAPPEHAQSKQLPASSQAPWRTQQVWVSQGPSLPFIGKIRPHYRVLKSKALCLVELAHLWKILKVMWKCGINTLWKQCDKTKHHYVETLSSFN